MLERVQDIPRIKSQISERDLQLALACKWLNHGYNSILGGDKLSGWLEKNAEKIESIFGSDDRVYIRCKTAEATRDLAEFVVKERIGDEVEWKQIQEPQRWWLYIWWD